MNLVFIYGPPGAGKLTVAREVARLTGYRLFDNHASIDCARAVFDFGTPPFWNAVGKIRSAVFEEAAAAAVSLVFTFVYSHPQDAAYIERTCGLFESRGGRALPVRLFCSREELEQRVTRPERAHARKLASLASLRDLLERHELFAPVPGRESLEVDNTGVEPAEVARLIVAHYRLDVVSG